VLSCVRCPNEALNPAGVKFGPRLLYEVGDPRRSIRNNHIWATTRYVR
jgi:hypothetical protein